MAHPSDSFGFDFQISNVLATSLSVKVPMQDLVWLEHEADLSETPILKGYDSPFEYLSYRLKCI